MTERFENLLNNYTLSLLSIAKQQNKKDQNKLWFLAVKIINYLPKNRNFAPSLCRINMMISGLILTIFGVLMAFLGCIVDGVFAKNIQETDVSKCLYSGDMAISRTCQPPKSRFFRGPASGNCYELMYLPKFQMSTHQKLFTDLRMVTHQNFIWITYTYQN